MKPLWSSRPLPPQAALVVVALLFLCLAAAPISNAHNITRILEKHPQFSTFNHYLTVTHLAAEINHRLTITVLAINNSAMSALLDKHLSIGSLKNLLSLHILVDYFGTKKLHQIGDGTTLTSTMFQATGAAPGTSGYVNITDLKGGKVGFGAEDNGGTLGSVFVKSITEIPYNISILQINRLESNALPMNCLEKALSSPEAEAPMPGPSDLNLTTILRKQGCAAFANLIVETGADKSFEENIEGGLTVFCPSDTTLNAFAPKYKNLTKAQRLSLLLYHGIPIYQSMQMLRSNNGLMNTLATNGANKYDFTVQNDGEEVTLETKVVTVKVTGTVIDEDPLVIYKIDTVLQPEELFKATAKAATAPKARKGKITKEADGPVADSPEGDPEDQTADNENAAGVTGVRMGLGVVLGLVLSVVVV